MRAVFDTNILIDYLLGIEKAKLELEKHQSPAISIISWMELLVGSKDLEDEKIIRDFLQQFSCVGFSKPIAEEAIRLRRQYRLRLPDAIIWATARVDNCLLVTRNFRDFPKDDIGVRVPYHVHQP